MIFEKISNVIKKYTQSKPKMQTPTHPQPSSTMFLRSKRSYPFASQTHVVKRRKTNFFDKSILIYDVETSNLSEKCGGRVVELACVLVKNGKVSKTFHSYFNPNMPCWSGAYKAHGLGDAFLRCQKPFRHSAGLLKKLFDECDVRCAHNGDRFDDAFLNAEFARAYLHEKVDELYSKNPLLFIPLTKGVNTTLFDRESFIENIVNAGMMYYFREYLQRDTLSGGKPGCLMFCNETSVFPNPKTHPENYNACMMRLSYFRLIKIPTHSDANRKRLTHPLEKNVLTAVNAAETTLMWIVNAFQLGILKENEFRRDFIGKSEMFDTLKFAKDNSDTFKRGFSVENLKLDTLLDYYKINRYARESGNHGAAIDTQLLLQLLRHMHKHSPSKHSSEDFVDALFSKTPEEQMQYFFKKNSFQVFAEEGYIASRRTLHYDELGSGFGDSYTKVTPPRLDLSGAIITKLEGKKVVVKINGWIFTAEGEWKKE